MAQEQGGQDGKKESPYLASGTKIKTEHVVESGETLGDLAMKYYGSAAKDKWMAIYEANKRVIGDDPNVIKQGQRLKIPDLEG